MDRSVVGAVAPWLPAPPPPASEFVLARLDAYWRALGVTDPRHIEALIGVVTGDNDAEVRASAASVLGTYVFHGVEQEVLPPFYFRVRNFLVETVRDESNDMLVRRAALEAVSFDGGEDVADLIKWAYAHSDREMALSAIFSMGRNHYDRWVECLAKELA